MMSRPKLFSADQTSILLAFFIDSYEKNHLSVKVTDLLDHLFGGRSTALYSPEINLIGHLLYYCPLLICSTGARTIGQDFTALSPIYVAEDSVSSIWSSKRASVSLKPLDFSLKQLLCFLYVVLPYLSERKGIIYSNIVKTVAILKDDENIRVNQDSNVSALSNTLPTDTSAAVVPESQLSDSLWATVLKALTNSWHSIASSNYSRLDVLFKYVNNIHEYLFLLHGKYYEIALRLSSIQLVTHISPKMQLHLRSLSWLLGFRIVLLTYYAIRVIGKDIDEELNKPAAESISTSTRDLDTIDKSNPSTVTKDATINTFLSSMKSTHQCVLCLEPIAHMAVIPCGHFYCWSCIVPYSLQCNQNNSTDNEDEDGEIEVIEHIRNNKKTKSGMAKCPICRAEFTAKKVRAVHGYS